MPRNSQLDVATCIGCGARSRDGDCAAGCVDIALDLVECAAVDDARVRREALSARVAALSEIAEVAAGDGPCDWERLREQAREALRLPLPASTPWPEIVEAWGCLDCGRVDAPRPCLGVCIRRPVAMTDAGEYRAIAGELEALVSAEARLAAVARLLAQVTPRPGHVRQTQVVLAARARTALNRSPRTSAHR